MTGGRNRQAALLGDERRWLRGALTVLNPDQREVIVLCYFEGMSIQDIAEVTACPVGTVKTRLHYARRKLHAWTEDEAGGATFAHILVGQESRGLVAA